MAARTRRRRPAPQSGRGSTSSGFGMLVLGLVIGGISTALVLGMRGDRPTELGRGLKHLIEVSRSKSDVASAPSGASPEAAPAPKASFNTSFDFYTVLPEIERITALVSEQITRRDAARPGAAL